MSVYTVQAPLGPIGEIDYPKAVFLREGFSWGAFFFGGLWLLWRRLWIAAVLWLLVWGGLLWLAAPHLSDGSLFFTLLTLQFLLGLEGRALIRHKLANQHYQFLDVVSAKGLETAERLFYARVPAVAAELGRQTPPGPHVPPQNPDVLGLFPQPELRR
jgi:hypothetical protein